jgi:hypothetical protein
LAYDRQIKAKLEITCILSRSYNCDWGCPCRFNAKPTHGSESRVSMFEIIQSISSLYNILLIGLIATTIILFPHISYSYHGQEISILLDSAEFIPLDVGDNQVNIFANYTVNDPSFINQRINSVMKVYLPNGTLIKTSSSVDGFIVNQTKCDSCCTVY